MGIFSEKSQRRSKMPLNFLMRSTERLENSSAGASQIVSTADWTRSLLHNLREMLLATGPTNFALLREWPGAKTGHYLIIEPSETEGAQQIVATTVVQRFACNIMVSQLPDDAVPELYESIYEMYEHYLKSPVALPLQSLP